MKKLDLLAWLALAFVLCLMSMGASSCRKIHEDTSRYSAIGAGQATLILGGCQAELGRGYDSCAITKGGALPTLRMFFMNPAAYAISDCQFGIFKQDEVPAAGEVEVDLTPLRLQMEAQGFCLLRIEAVEQYSDPHSPDQLRQVITRGGFFVELWEDGYISEFPRELAAWCYVVKRTTKGRTQVEECKE